LLFRFAATRPSSPAKEEEDGGGYPPCLKVEREEEELERGTFADERPVPPAAS